jgi:UrcA family protein
MKTSARNSIYSIILGSAVALGVPLVQAEKMGETKITEQSSSTTMPTFIKRGRETRSTTITYADLRLESQAGLMTLYARVEGAAQTVCAPNAGKHGRDLNRHRDWQRCLNNAVDGAIADIDHSGLTAYHFAQTGRGVGDNERVAGR